MPPAEILRCLHRPLGLVEHRGGHARLSMSVSAAVDGRLRSGAVAGCGLAAVTAGGDGGGGPAAGVEAGAEDDAAPPVSMVSSASIGANLSEMGISRTSADSAEGELMTSSSLSTL